MKKTMLILVSVDENNSELPLLNSSSYRRGILAKPDKFYYVELLNNGYLIKRWGKS